MSQELLYTSAPRGLKPGSRGFCTVLSTQGMPAPLAAAVESLSGYRPVYPSNDERAARNPVVYSHLKMQATGRTWHVLSRIADFGLDYSQRPNKLAYHVILDNQTEKLPGGPANLLSMPGFMRDEWAGEPKVVALKPVTREPRELTGICYQWQEVTGDAGWAGVVAESFLRDPERLVILLFEPGQEVLPLFAEALSLLPPEQRWEVTFSTYFTGLATGTTCVWRAMVHDSKEARESLRFVHALRIDLTVASLGPAAGGELVAAAQSGHRSAAAPTRAKPPKPPSREKAGATDTQFEEMPESEQEQKEIRVASVPHRPPQFGEARGGLTTNAAPPIQRAGQRLALDTATQPRRIRSRRWKWASLICVALVMVTCAGFLVSRHSYLLEKYRAVRGLTDHETPKTEPSATRPQSVPNDEAAVSGNLRSAGAVPQTSGENRSEPQNTNPAPAAGSTTGQHQADPAPEKSEAPMAGLAPNAQDPINEISTTRANAIRLVQLPRQNAPCELYPAESGALKSKVNAKLLRPSWLTLAMEDISMNETTNSERRQSIFEQTGALDKSQPIAAVILKNDENEDASVYSLKTFDEGKSKWLSWCRIQIPVADTDALPKTIRFAEFPLTIDNSLRVLKKNGGSIKWNLRSVAPVEKATMPRLILDRIAISIQGHQHEFDLHDKKPRSSWKIDCSQLESDIYSVFDIMRHEKHCLAFNIDIIGDDGSIALSMTKVDKFLKGIDAAFSSQLQLKKNNLLDSIKGALASVTTTDIQIDQVSDQLNRLQVSTASTISLVGSLQKAVDELQKALRDEKAKTPPNLKILENCSDQLAAGGRLLMALRDFCSIRAEFDKISVVAVRLYYELEDEKDGKSRTPVDVVVFDQTKTTEPTTGAAMPKGTGP